MNRTLSIALIAVGILLLVFGLGALDSPASELSEAVQGAPTNKSIFLIAAGAVATIAGGVGLVRRRA